MIVAFMGSPPLAVPTLEALVEAGHEVACVYTAPPRPAGRGRARRKTPVHIRAEQFGIEVRCPTGLGTASEIDAFAEIGADVALVVAYGAILPRRMLDLPRFGCLNLHGSALPRWRGAAPVQRAIMAGDSKTALQVMRIETGLDTGPVMLSHPVALGASDTAGEVLARMASLGGELALRALDQLQRGEARFEPQTMSGVTYARKIDPAEARIDWTRPAGELRNHIHGLSPAPGAWCEHGGERLRILRAETWAGASGRPGEIMDHAFSVACGDGALRIVEAQRPGRRAMAAAEFLRGHPLAPGAELR